jgi:hypothetical protein
MNAGHLERKGDGVRKKGDGTVTGNIYMHYHVNLKFDPLCINLTPPFKYLTPDVINLTPDVIILTPDVIILTPPYKIFDPRCNKFDPWCNNLDPKVE